MKPLETQVRKELTNQKTEELYQLMQDSRYKEAVRDFASIFWNSLFDAFGRSWDDPKRIEMNQELNESDDVLFDPEQLREMSYESAKLAYLSQDEREVTYASYYEKLEEEGLDNEALEELKKVTEGVNKFFKIQDDVVDVLLEIAEKESINEALSEEKQDLVTRKIIPTANEYVAYRLTGLDVMKGFLSNAQKAMMIDAGEAGQLEGNIYEALYKGFEKVQGTIEELGREWLYKEAERIYG